MSVLFVQHGKSLPKEQDPERGLSQEGIHDGGDVGDGY
jgi:phosphohistidine phosphatase SixA